MDKIETRGGARPGSGRKSISQERKRVQITISISPETKARIDTMRAKGIKVGVVLDDLIRQYFDGM